MNIKTCIYCQNTSLTKEHFWPKWLHDHIPDPPSNSRSYSIFESGIEIDKGERPGHLKNKIIRKVCQSCNNGWMSTIESSVIPILKKMLNGSCVLNENQILNLAQWIFLKVTTAEHDREDYVVTSKRHLVEFKSSLDIPKNFNIWLGKFDSGSGGTAYVRRSATISLSPTCFLETGTNFNTQTVTFCIGEIILHVRHSTILSLNFDTLVPDPDCLMPLYPDIGSIHWPPNPKLSIEEAGRLAYCLDPILEKIYS
ncbi:MAG: hypothetical protein ACHQAX_09190 [Gammaproteobacteria bacterium]